MESTEVMMAILQNLRRLFDSIKARSHGGIVRTPTVLQMENTECAAASLSIVLQYYGRYVPLSQLRELCGVSRDGSDAANLILAARSLGFNAKGFKKGLQALARTKPPLILFWEFNHFLVCEGFTDDHVALNDPALGPRSVKLEEFDDSYTGIAIVLEPSTTFSCGGKAPSVWPIVSKRLGSEPLGVAFILLAGLLLILPKLILPIFAQVYMDEIIGNGMENWIKPMLWAMAVTIAIQGLIQYLQLVGSRKLKKRLNRRFVAQFEHQMLALPENYYAQRHAADIANRMQSNNSIAEFIAERLIPMTTGFVLLIFYLIITLLYSPVLGLIVGLSTGINALVVIANRRMQKDSNLKILKDTAKADSIIVSGIRNIETVKASSVEADICKRFGGYQAKMLNTQHDLELLKAKIRLVPNALTTLNEITILVIGFWLVIQGQLTLGMLLAAQTIALSLKGQIDKVIEFFGSLPEFEAEILRLEDVLEQPRDPVISIAPPLSSWAGPSARLSGALQINNVSFGYSPLKPPLLLDISLQVAPGQRIAFVGGSGSGKSTISRLIAGLYRPRSGSILYDGLVIEEIPREVAILSLAMVQQEVALYGCSIRDNLTLWNSGVSELDIHRACSDAQILDTILALPDGFETVLREGGCNLSGGQRQRMEIARALIQNPSILILDEATSALDSATEQHVNQALRRRGCTQIIVAHRMSTIRDSDLIVVLENGKVVQQGRHDDMIVARESPYQKLLSVSA